MIGGKPAVILVNSRCNTVHRRFRAKKWRACGVSKISPPAVIDRTVEIVFRKIWSGGAAPLMFGVIKFCQNMRNKTVGFF